ncbi:hypothetical protein CRX69_02025 [Pseudomonas rhizophila]|jgi:hypothetical protein|uniref:Uncharacterized protein n=1 Tax=Pseudomonas rhizophila TaxID=2045200 RepID=A0ABN5JLH4_9PSED|nr:hypothetical protein CRX69_02025 [Pseudomonas rhizophila]
MTAFILWEQSLLAMAVVQLMKMLDVGCVGLIANKFCSHKSCLNWSDGAQPQEQVGYKAASRASFAPTSACSNRSD